MKKFENYRNPLGLAFTAVVTVLALAGSYQYYTQYAENIDPGRLWSAIVFSTAKLYAFSPTAGVGERTPLLYEIAKWTAPLCTAYWLFRMLDSLMRHRMEILARLLTRQKQILVFGYNRESDAFLQNLLQEKGGKHRLMLVAEEPLEQEKRRWLEKKHILVWHKNLLDEKNVHAEKRWMRKWLGRCGEMILFYEDATVNFILLKNLMSAAGERNKGEKARLCSLRCEDRVMKRIITNYYDEYKGGRRFDLNLFSMPEIAAYDLFREEPLYRNCLDRAAGLMADGALDAERLLEEVPNPHLLIAGFGRYGQAVLEEALYMGRLSCRSRVPGYEKLRVTVIDSDPKRCRSIIEAGYPRIDRLCDIRFIACEAGSPGVERELDRLPPVTYAAVCFSDQTVNVRALENLCRYFRLDRKLREKEYYFRGEVPVAVRMRINGSIIRYFTARERGEGRPGYILKDFGAEKQILTHQNVTRSHLEREARSFHVAYAAVQRDSGAEIFADTEELWEMLDFEKKESNRVQVRSLPYMSALLSLLPALPPREIILSEGKDFRRLAELLGGNPVLEALAAQEHSRWCGFCYAYGYVGCHPDPGEKGKEHRILENGRQYYGLVHYCLIDDWEQVKADPVAWETVFYDIAAVYGYQEACRRGPAGGAG